MLEHQKCSQPWNFTNKHFFFFFRTKIPVNGRGFWPKTAHRCLKTQKWGLADRKSASVAKSWSKWGLKMEKSFKRKRKLIFLTGSKYFSNFQGFTLVFSQKVRRISPFLANFSKKFSKMTNFLGISTGSSSVSAGSGQIFQVFKVF